jgi:SpoVK/Ycf46/Vps4 family AAA+-type ATPase
VVAALVHELDSLADAMVDVSIAGGGEGRRGGSRVLLVAATNRADAIDVALRQPGRLDLEIEVGVPNAGGRRQILDMMLAKVSCLCDACNRVMLAKVSCCHACKGFVPRPSTLD